MISRIVFPLSLPAILAGAFPFYTIQPSSVINYRLTKDRHTAGMVETAEQHSKISKRYDKLADDESMSPNGSEKRPREKSLIAFVGRREHDAFALAPCTRQLRSGAHQTATAADRRR